MPLNKMRPNEIGRLSVSLVALHAAMMQLVDDDLAPVADLTPGQPVRITLLGFALPEAEAAKPVDLLGPETLIERVDRIDHVTENLLGDLTHEVEQLRKFAVAELRVLHRAAGTFDQSVLKDHLVPSKPADPGAGRAVDDLIAQTVAAASAEAEPGEGRAGSYDQEDEIDERAFASADPSRSEEPGQVSPNTGLTEGVAESDGGQASAAAEPTAAPPVASEAPTEVDPPAPAVGSASALAASTIGAAGKNRWTEEEDARLIDAIVGGVVGQAMPVKAAIRAAAEQVGRPEQASQYRVYHVLKARLDAALEIARVGNDAGPDEDLVPPAPLADPAPEEDLTLPAMEMTDAYEVEAAPEPAPEKAWTQSEHIADPVTAHLMALPTKGGWTLARDLELMELSIAGWQPNEIALQLTVQANLIKPRFDALTGLVEDAAGKKQRRFGREAVLAALQSLVARDAKAGAA